VKVGDVIDGKYELVRLIGQGGMGAVWAGRHVQIGRRVALKFLHPQIAHNAEIASRFLREAQAAASIGSDHIVDIYDVGHLPNGIPYLVMEYLEGEDLASVLKREVRLEPPRAVDLILQLCEALAPAHERGIVHRDLKPANLILIHREKYGEWLKVLDFGIAKIRLPAIGQSSAHLTKTGATLGTPHFMAPEQFMGAHEVDPRADVYSSGVILYQLLTGITPFTGSTYEELIVTIATGVVRPPRELRGELDGKISDIVLRAMHREVGQRFPTMDDLALELRPFAGKRGGLVVLATSTQTEDDAPTSPVRAVRIGSKPIIPRTLPEGATEPKLVAPTVVGPFPVQSGPVPVGATPSAWESKGGLIARSRALSPRKLWIGVGGVAFVAALATLVGIVAMSGGAQDEGSGSRSGAQPHAQPSSPNAAADMEGYSIQPARWVHIDPAPMNFLLGLPDRMSSYRARGFRASRLVTAPTYSYEIQQHEVTWGELRPWLMQHTELTVAPPGWLPSDNPERYPATGIPWLVAINYCGNLGGSLPTEEEWEYAARGRESRPYPWGRQAVDLARTHVFRWPGQPLSRVMTSEQDVTPGDATRAIFDLLGNAREWTTDLWREDEPDQDESWVQNEAVSFRAVRGLPPTTSGPSPIPAIGAAHRDALCATGECPGETAQVLAYVGFRCSRRAR
jgi:serine/threonine-protein kinase